MVFVADALFGNEALFLFVSLVMVTSIVSVCALRVGRVVLRALLFLVLGFGLYAIATEAYSLVPSDPVRYTMELINEARSRFDRMRGINEAWSQGREIMDRWRRG